MFKIQLHYFLYLIFKDSNLLFKIQSPSEWLPKTKYYLKFSKSSNRSTLGGKLFFFYFFFPLKKWTTVLKQVLWNKLRELLMLMERNAYLIVSRFLNTHWLPVEYITQPSYICDGSPLLLLGVTLFTCKHIWLCISSRACLDVSTCMIRDLNSVLQLFAVSVPNLPGCLGA